jgi:hypothetical protein
MPIAHSRIHALAALLALASLSACATVKTTLEAKPTTASQFLDPSHAMQEMGPRSPFLRSWTSGSQSQRIESVGRTEIYIAPVETRYLRPIQAKMAARQQRRWNRERPTGEIANTVRQEFIKAFENSKEPRYRVVDRRTPNSVTLELALIELDPSSISGNLIRKAATLKAGPVPALASILTNGHIAIEGRLIDSTKKWSLFEFADVEKDKMTFWTLRDFQPYGHSKVAIREWARQFEATTRNPDWAEMGDARIWTLSPW